MDNASVGRVESVRSETCIVGGLRGVGLSNVVTFSSGATGIVLGFEHQTAQVVMLEAYDKVKKGDLVRIISRYPVITVSQKLLGRVIDPLGRALDGRGDIDTVGAVSLPVEIAARPIYQRAIVDRPLQTGYALIDSQIPIGLGQRELLLGESKSGQVDVAIDAICNQARLKTGTICIYVAIDSEVAVTKRNVEKLEKAGALQQTVVVFGRTASAASMNYIAPMVGMSIAEWFMTQGKNVLVVFDDMTRHAKVYRQLSLLLNRPASREAYPGDIFYLHSRLLERCGAFNEHAGGGTITALPIVETATEEVTDYITTNLMSITDGHVLFRRALANKGLHPPIDSGFSVSRIGGRIQSKLIRELSDQLKDILIRFSEIERFIAFGTDLNSDSLELYNLGLRARSLFDQTSDDFFTPLQQALMLYMITSKKALDWGPEQMKELRSTFLAFVGKSPYDKLITPSMLQAYDKTITDTFDDCIKDFMKDPKTPKPVDKTPRLVAETETISGILRENEDMFHDKD
ncbi:F0F1 ATP synthase subunit alpha [Candidatus Saccharibacteria bacterium]|nr:F0F1 ATP synthase subunit alpha [Candidatus Saccharibacteria bacterium]